MAEELERARKAVRELSKTLKSLPKDPPPTEVHKLRTTTRRVEAIVSVLAQVEGKESRRLLKSIEPIRKAAGGVREMDVMIGNARKLARHAARRFPHPPRRAAPNRSPAKCRGVAARARPPAHGGAGKPERVLEPDSNSRGSYGRDGIDATDCLPMNTTGSIVQRPTLSARLGEWPPLNAENIHAFRLKVKELRYILQLSDDANSDLGEALGNVQRRVGDWHDWHQLHEIASEVLIPERDLALLERIDETTKRKFDQALAAANRLRGKYLSMPVAQGA